MDILERVERIGDILPIGKLTLLFGLAGVGKTVTLLKFLNSVDVTPIYFNLDHTEVNGTATHMYDEEILKKFICGEYSELSGQVVVIDTYTRFESIIHELFESKLSRMSKLQSDKYITLYLEKIVEQYDVTLVVIGHPEDYVGRASVFKDNQTLVRNCYEAIYIEKIIPTKKGTSKSDIQYVTHIQKNRGNNGATIIDNWMR